MRAFAWLLMVLATLPVLAAETGRKLEGDVSTFELMLLVTSGPLCEPAVANAETVEAAVQAADDATPVDVRGFILGQQQMLLREAQVQPIMYTENICAAARDIAFRYGLD